MIWGTKKLNSIIKKAKHITKLASPNRSQSNCQLVLLEQPRACAVIPVPAGGRQASVPPSGFFVRKKRKQKQNT
ncbi:MAG TPA: hypothetical protein P5033_10775, partial [Anaerohalosphaeraceae bacterium]|nr:hypothetical protein [Anaerohalosphaeraceae bacterium]